MDRCLALEDPAPCVLDVLQPEPNDTCRAGRRVIASERTTTMMRTLVEEAAFFAGGPVADAPSRRVRPDD